MTPIVQIVHASTYTYFLLDNKGQIIYINDILSFINCYIHSYAIYNGSTINNCIHYINILNYVLIYNIYNI